MKHFLIGCLIGFVIIAVMWETCRISFAIGFVQGYRASEAGCSEPEERGDNNKSQLRPTVQKPLVLPIRL